jgi:hypothetical protein
VHAQATVKITHGTKYISLPKHKPHCILWVTSLAPTGIRPQDCPAQSEVILELQEYIKAQFFFFRVSFVKYFEIHL